MCVCVCGKGREKWPQKLAMTTGFKYMSQGRQGRQGVEGAV